MDAVIQQRRFTYGKSNCRSSVGSSPSLYSRTAFAVGTGAFDIGFLVDDDSPVNYFALSQRQLFSSVGDVSGQLSFTIMFQKAPVLGRFHGLKRLFLQTHNVVEMQDLTNLDELVLLDFAEIVII